MGNKIPHMGVIHSAVRRRFPCIKGFIIAWKNTDNIDIFWVAESVGLWVGQLSAEYEMQALGHRGSFLIGFPDQVAVFQGSIKARMISA